jgi:hypothetical protein
MIALVCFRVRISTSSYKTGSARASDPVYTRNGGHVFDQQSGSPVCPSLGAPTGTHLSDFLVEPEQNSTATYAGAGGAVEEVEPFRLMNAAEAVLAMRACEISAR